MKGVIVQMGEPKSIVLFNNGKIGAIPTPADCHVGKVVSVKLNSRFKIIALILAAVLLLALGVFIGVFVAQDKAAPPSMMPMHEGGGRGLMMRRGWADNDEKNPPPHF
jgi:hypothetical protein